MKKILLFLLLSIFCFSDNTLLKGINWGDSQEDIINKQGKPSKINKKKEEMKYYNLKLENINLDEVNFQFKDNKLVSWSAGTKVDKKEAYDCIDILKENSNLKLLKKLLSGGEYYKGVTEERTVVFMVTIQAFGRRSLSMEFNKPE